MYVNAGTACQSVPVSNRKSFLSYSCPHLLERFVVVLFYIEEINDFFLQRSDVILYVMYI